MIKSCKFLGDKFNYRYLVKKIKIDNRIYNLDLFNIKNVLDNKINYSLIGTTSQEIIENMNKFFNLNK